VPAGIHGPAVSHKPKETMMFRAFTTAFILALTVTAAQAAPVFDVKFNDLDLSKPSDASVLESRVHQAANRVCGQLRQSFPTSLDYRIWFNSCMRATIAETTRWVEARAGHHRSFASN
jgi:UrcA family protein